MNNDEQKERVIETASATTSSDNSQSGPFAYIIAAVTLGLLVVAGLAIGGCTSAVISAIPQEPSSSHYSSPYGTNNYSPYDNYNDYDKDFEEWLQQYEDLYSDTTDTPSKTDSANVADILDFGIAVYGEDINDALSASSYAGISNELRTYVRSFVNADSDYTKQLQSLLNDAALKEESRSVSIKQAIQLCDEARAHFNDLDVTGLSSANAEQVKDSIGSAKQAAVKRWQALHDEISLLDTTDQVDTVRLWSFDDDVYDATDEAAQYLEQAMSAEKSK